MVNTVDPRAATLAERYGARVVSEGARDGHTGAVNGMARVLAAEGDAALLTVPGDIPRVTAGEIDAIVAARRPAPSFTIAPPPAPPPPPPPSPRAPPPRAPTAGCAPPPSAVPWRSGDDSFYPPRAAPRAGGTDPIIVPLAGIGLDIAHPADLMAFLRATPRM